MPKTTKDKIKQAADLEERNMADWARIELRKAAEHVIALHTKPAPLPFPSKESMVADAADYPAPPPAKKTTYPRVVKKLPAPPADEKQA